MNNLLYFNNNTPNYEYILKDIIIDNNLSELNDFFTKDEFYSVFNTTKDQFTQIFNDFKEDNTNIIYNNNCDYKMKYNLYCDNLYNLINKLKILFDNTYFNFKYIDCCSQTNKDVLNYFSFDQLDKSFKKEFYLQSINLYFNKNDLSIYIILNNKNKRINITKPICIKNNKIKKLHFNQIINYVDNLNIVNITNYIFKIL
jgi:hypothetical protein